MVRAVDKADANADVFQRSIISEAIYHFTINIRPTIQTDSIAVGATYREDSDPASVDRVPVNDIIRKHGDSADKRLAVMSMTRLIKTPTSPVMVVNQRVHLEVVADTCHSFITIKQKDNKEVWP